MKVFVWSDAAEVGQLFTKLLEKEGRKKNSPIISCLFLLQLFPL